MNKFSGILVLTLLSISASNTFGQVASPRTTHAEGLAATDDVQQVLAVDEARRLAMLHGDFSTLDSLLADDATIFWGDGTADDKASTLALLRSGRLRYAQLDYENTRVRLYGGTAVVTGQARVKEQSDNERRSYVVRVTRVCMPTGPLAPGREPNNPVGAFMR